MPAAIIVASASVGVAVLAFALNQYGQGRQERRQARLSRVSSQLRDLYGPLNAMVDANERIWEALRARHLPEAAKRSPAGATPDWRRWRDEVLQPANDHMRDLIFTHADLLIETEMPEPLREFCAHVSAQDIVRTTEADGIIEPILVAHPGTEYVSYVRRSFASLKTEQSYLLCQPSTRSLRPRSRSRIIRTRTLEKMSMVRAGLTSNQVGDRRSPPTSCSPTPGKTGSEC
jgi:hypothetical protein